MFKKILYSILFSICFLGFSACFSSAKYDPLSVPNNRIGIHILDTSEVYSAAKLVNSSGGDWGYVTIPIRSNDRDYDKWYVFFKNCSQLHLIPIIRLATYPSDLIWIEPTIYDLQDFANFLDAMPWPVQNRYLILFNEPNHSKEWGGRVDPSTYGQILSDAHQIFKSKNSDFYLLSAGLDMSAPSNYTSLDAFDFYRQLSQYHPDWFQNIDGISMHVYPNPDFRANPLSSGRYGSKSYLFELNYLKKNGYVPPVIFITETGYLGPQKFYPVVLDRVWTQKNIIAITPFVLSANSPDFSLFSFLDYQGQPKANYQELLSYPKIAGRPIIASASALLQNQSTFVSSPSSVTPISSSSFVDRLFIFLGLKTPRLQIGSAIYKVEVVKNKSDQARGLSDRDFLAPDSGMLFIFPDSRIRSFWMKNMNFPLDFLWINHNRIVNIHTNIPPPDPNTTPWILSSVYPVNWVLEINAGQASISGIRLGDYVKLIN